MNLPVEFYDRYVPNTQNNVNQMIEVFLAKLPKAFKTLEELKADQAQYDDSQFAKLRWSI